MSPFLMKIMCLAFIQLGLPVLSKSVTVGDQTCSLGLQLAVFSAAPLLRASRSAITDIQRRQKKQMHLIVRPPR